MTLRGSSVPRSLTVDEVVVVDGEAVVFAAGAVHALNATATLIWQSCDGAVTLDRLADELAESFDLDPVDARRDVVAVADELLARNLITVDAVGSRAASPGTEPASLPVFQPSPACSGCGEGPGYEQHLLVTSGDVVLSVGADAEILDALAECLGPRVVDRVLVPEDRASYGVVIPSGSRGPGPVDLSRLHRGPDVLLASRDPERVLRALVAQVALHAVEPPLLRLDAIAVGGAGRAVLTAMPFHRALYARDAANHGLALSDASGIAVRLRPAMVISGPAWTDLDLGPLERVAATRRHLGAEPAALPWGELELVAIAVQGAPNAASVLGELGGGATWDSVAPLQSFLDLAATVPLISGTSPEQIAALLDTD